MSSLGVYIINDAVSRIKSSMGEDRFTREELEQIMEILKAAIKATEETLRRGPGEVNKESKP